MAAQAFNIPRPNRVKEDGKSRSVRANKKCKVAGSEVELTLEDADDRSDDECEADNMEIM